MSADAIAILHAGEMGSAVGAALRAIGTRVLWASEGRGADTYRRARAAGLEDAGTLEQVVRESAVIISICPPAAAMEVAEGVARQRLAGTYVDANAISPATAGAVAAVIEPAGAMFVDGGIIGPPPRQPGATGCTCRDRRPGRSQPVSPAACWRPSRSPVRSRPP